jgi:hypothetical protein
MIPLMSHMKVTGAGQPSALMVGAEHLQQRDL